MRCGEWGLGEEVDEVGFGFAKSGEDGDLVFDEDGAFEEHGIGGKGGDPLCVAPVVPFGAEGAVGLAGGVAEGFVPQLTHPGCD